MKFKDFVASCQKLLEDNPSYGEFPVVYSRDEEGNGFERVFYSPSSGVFEDGDFEDDTLMPNAVCIN